MCRVFLCQACVQEWGGAAGKCQHCFHPATRLWRWAIVCDPCQTKFGALSARFKCTLDDLATVECARRRHVYDEKEHPWLEKCKYFDMPTYRPHNCENCKECVHDHTSEQQAICDAAASAKAKKERMMAFLLGLTSTDSKGVARL